MIARRILSIEYSAPVLETRNAVLRSAGYEISSASTFYQALERLQENRFDLVLIGRSIPGVQLRGFLELIQLRAPAARTMVLRDCSQDNDFRADCLHDPDAGPEALLSVIESLFGKIQRASA
jgi:DNA-binding response OmpR family regulator